jgi:REP element-mobilizing transposase RayT
MARCLRIQFCGARYHVINRGNLQHDIFASRGAIRSFLATLAQAAPQFGWRVHAYVVMRNHYHLALETPQPNLVEGMHWLQSTFALRLTRFHGQHGHVFQGRYKSLLVEDPFHLARVCDYIHLNPVRAHVVSPDQLGDFQASSLSRWLNGTAPAWLPGADVLRESGCAHEPSPWPTYAMHLARIATVGGDDPRATRGAYSRGWAIGTSGWRRTLAREHQHLALAPEMSAVEIADFKTARWQEALHAGLSAMGRTPLDLEHTPKGAEW